MNAWNDIRREHKYFVEAHPPLQSNGQLCHLFDENVMEASAGGAAQEQMGRQRCPGKRDRKLKGRGCVMCPHERQSETLKGLNRLRSEARLRRQTS